MKPQLNHKNLKDVVHYVCFTCPVVDLGAVKLNKVLYYSDMLFFAAHGRPLTGAAYRKRPYGPTTDSLLRAIRDLKAEGSIEESETEYFGFRKKDYRSLVDFDVSKLTNAEIVCLDEIVEFVCRKNTARSISELSHDWVWHVAEMGEEMPYTAALLWNPSLVSDESKEWALKEAQEIENRESVGNPVSRRPFRLVRGGVE